MVAPIDPRQARRSKEELLTACEAAVTRLVQDQRYFRNPSRALFEQVRHHFRVSDQVVVRATIERHMRLAADYLDRMPEEQAALLRHRHCRALTRQGTPCRRTPLPGSDFCPSHKHLEELLGSTERTA